MNLEKVVFAFFIVLALTVNFGFFIGEFDDPNHHNIYELYAAVVVNLVATVLKFGDRTHVGAVLLATSLVADLQPVQPGWPGRHSDPGAVDAAGGLLEAPVLHLDRAGRSGDQ